MMSATLLRARSPREARRASPGGHDAQRLLGEDHDQSAAAAGDVAETARPASGATVRSCSPCADDYRHATMCAFAVELRGHVGEGGDPAGRDGSGAAIDV